MEVIKRVDEYWGEQSKRVAAIIEKKALEIGEKCDRYMENAPARTKYVCEVLLRVPLFLIIHQWLLLSPYSSYWIIDIFLFILRYKVASVLMRTWMFNTGLNFQVFTYLFMDIAIAWVRHVSYWSYQNGAHGVSHEQNVFVWCDFTDSWRIPAIISILIQFLYFCYRPGIFLNREPMSSRIHVVLFATLLPDIFSMTGVFTSFFSELSYWLQSAVFLICLLNVVSSTEIDTEVDIKKIQVLKAKRKLATDAQKKMVYKNRLKDIQKRIDKRQQGGNYEEQFPGKWFLRDAILAFGIPYLMFALLFELIIYQRAVTSLFTLDSVLEISSRWCTTLVIVVVISYGLGILSTLCVVLSHFFLTTEVNMTAAFDANIGGIAQFFALIAFTEANILSLGYTEKPEAMKMVVFLSLCDIFFQTLDYLERKILDAVNSGTSPGISFHLRAGILIGLLVTAPTLSTFIVSKDLDVNPWLLFFASGNCTLILLTVFMLTECFLVALTWYIPQHLSKLENIIHYIRVSKSLGLFILNTVQCYCRYVCPFFKGWWFFRLCLALFSLLVVAGVLVFTEYYRYQIRNRMVTLLNNLPDVTFRSSTEDAHECAICYSVMTRAKALPCAHAFHKDCLRRWFQVKTVCPFCNTDIQIDTQPGNAGTAFQVFCAFIGIPYNY